MDKQEGAAHKKRSMHPTSLFQAAGLRQTNRRVIEKTKNENATIVWLIVGA
jgi:hypothetical protein